MNLLCNLLNKVVKYLRLKIYCRRIVVYIETNEDNYIDWIYPDDGNRMKKETYKYKITKLLDS